MSVSGSVSGKTASQFAWFNNVQKAELGAWFKFLDSHTLEIWDNVLALNQLSAAFKELAWTVQGTSVLVTEFGWVMEELEDEE